MKTIVYNFAFLLFFIVSMRLIPHPPNFTPVLATAILSPHIFSNKILPSVLLLTLAMFISDIFLGLHKFLIFTYIPLIIIVFLSNYINFSKTNIIIMTLLSPLIFFLVSNFGVWLLTDFYPKDLGGLFQSYLLAIPFLQNSFIGTIVYLLLYFILYNISIYMISKYNPKILEYKNSLKYINN